MNFIAKAGLALWFTSTLIIFTDKEGDDIDFTCELDEYAQLVKDVKDSGIIKDHRKGIRFHKNSFIGKELVDWLMLSKRVGKYELYELFLDFTETKPYTKQLHFLVQST